VSIASGAPDGPEEPVGVVLARLRRARGLTGAVLAAMTGMSQPKISRIERGKGLPDPEDVGALARALGADEQTVAGLKERAERSHDQITDWRPASESLVVRQTNMARWESTAREVREFEPAVLPGLLQTSGYAKAVLRGFQRVQALDTDDFAEAAVLAAVSERIRRQEILADRAKTFWFVIAEAVLRNRICPPIEMLAQIGHLREISTQRNTVDIRVIPDDAPMIVPPLHGLMLIDDQMIVIDAFNTGLISRGRKDTETYRRVFDMFHDQAIAIEPLLDRYELLYVKQLDRLSGGREPR